MYDYAKRPDQKTGLRSGPRNSTGWYVFMVGVGIYVCVYVRPDHGPDRTGPFRRTVAISTGEKSCDVTKCVRIETVNPLNSLNVVAVWMTLLSSITKKKL